MDKIQRAREFYEAHKMKKGSDFRLEYLKLSKEDIYDFMDELMSDRIHEWRQELHRSKDKATRLESKIESLQLDGGEVDFYCVGEERFLGGGVDFGDELLKALKHSMSSIDTKKMDWVIILNKHLNTEPTRNKKDVLAGIFKDNTFLNYRFAKKLNIFDTINPRCFNSNDTLGSSIIELCINADIVFIVKCKYYAGENSISIDFQAVYDDLSSDFIQSLITGK